MSNTINNTDDIISMSDITDRVDALEAADEDISSEEAVEHAALLGLLEDMKGNGGGHQWRGDWYPGFMFRDSYFNTAMDELLEDIGDLPCYLPVTVDYDALQMDYSSVEFDGVTYWYR